MKMKNTQELLNDMQTLLGRSGWWGELDAFTRHMGEGDPQQLVDWLCGWAKNRCQEAVEIATLAGEIGRSIQETQE